MKKIALLILLTLSTPLWAISPEFTLHLDKAFLHARDRRDEMVEALEKILAPFCATVATADAVRLANMDLAARESCRLGEVVAELQISESELHIKNGASYLASAQAADADEAAVWRYFIRTQKARHLIQSVRAYLARGAGGPGRARVGMFSIPMFAAALDNYSYWSRLIAMKNASDCSEGNPEFCETLRAQLGSLAELGWGLSKRPGDGGALNSGNQFVLGLAKTLRARLASLTLEELGQFDKMDNVTAAGLGVTFFRQMVGRLNISSAELSTVDQRRVRDAIVLNEIEEALAGWALPKTPVEVNAGAVEALSQELNKLSTSGVMI